MARWPDSGEEEEIDAATVGYALLGLGIVLVACACCARSCCAYCCCCLPCCRCCRRRLLDQADQPGSAAAKVRVGNDADVPSSLLKQKKELVTAYLLYACVGWTGAHHFYLNRLIHGMFCVWSLNFFLLGAVADFFLMPIYVRNANQGAASASRHDGSTCRIALRLPCIWILILAFPITLIVVIPTALHHLQVVDLQSRAAGTAQNPYDILGVEHGASARTAEAAHTLRMSQLKSGSRCNATCKEEKEELKRAYDFATGATWKRVSEEKERREARDSNDGSRVRRRRERQRKGKDPDRKSPWGDWSSYKAYEWELATDALKDALNEFAKRRDNATYADDDEEGDEGGADYGNDEL